MGKTGQVVPVMDAEWVTTISKRYIELYELVTGSAFLPEELGDEDTYAKIVASLEKNGVLA